MQLGSTQRGDDVACLSVWRRSVGRLLATPGRCELALFLATGAALTWMTERALVAELLGQLRTPPSGLASPQ